MYREDRFDNRERGGYNRDNRDKNRRSSGGSGGGGGRRDYGAGRDYERSGGRRMYLLYLCPFLVLLVGTAMLVFPIFVTIFLWFLLSSWCCILVCN